MRIFKTGRAMLLSAAILTLTGAPVCAYAADTSQKLASYTTYFSGGNTGRNRNMKLGAEKNSVTVKAGASFSFNRNTGNSTSTANGWNEAPILVGGRRTTGIGGGLCQCSSTIYSAVKQVKNLTILERRPHSVPVGYVPVSGEAMVNYGSSDFRFRNDNPFDIYVQVTIDMYDGWMTATVYTAGDARAKDGKELTVLLDGETLYSNVTPRIYQDRVYVEMRSLFEALGYSVTYGAASNTVRMKRGSTEFVLKNGAASQSVKRIKNGKETSISLPYPLKNVSGRIMIPLRFAGDLLGYSVSWNAKTRVASMWRA